MFESNINCMVPGITHRPCVYWHPDLNWDTEDPKRGNWVSSKLFDCYGITNEAVIWNSLSAACCCQGIDVLDAGDGYVALNTRKFADHYSLCPCAAPFGSQPICAGPCCTAVLVTEDIVATAPHFVNQDNLSSRTFVFGFIMVTPDTAVTRIPVSDVYYGVDIIGQSKDAGKLQGFYKDWILIRLDRKVEGRKPVTLSDKSAHSGQNVYALGHPCGLPMKYASGGKIVSIEKNRFTSAISLYNSNSGSPVFCAETHEMVGIVAASDPNDFKRVGNCCVPINYPNKKIFSSGASCVKISEFSEFIKRSKHETKRKWKYV